MLAAPLAADEGAELGWVEREDLPAALEARVPEYCDGVYVEPVFAEPLDSRPEDFPIVADADRAEVWIDERAVLTGSVAVRQGNRTLDADVATYTHADRSVVAEGSTVVREPGLVVLGERAALDLDSGEVEVDDAEFLLFEKQMRGRAARIGRDDVATLRAEKTRFTRCEPGNDSWVVHARSIEVEDGAIWGVARSAVMRVENVPVFYAPYLRFPVTDERTSGFLFPQLGFGDEGADIGLPYYFNLAPNYDALVEPRWIEDRGAGAEGQFRHLSGWARTELGGAFLYKDDLYDGTLSKDDYEQLGSPGPFDPANRWLMRALHDGEFGHFRTNVDYTKVSDDDYFRDLGTDLDVTSQVDLERSAEIQFYADGLLARLWSQSFQNLDDTRRDAYQRLPELALGYQGRLLGPLQWSLATSASRFERGHEELNTGIEAINGNRLHVEPHVLLPLYSPFGFFRLNGGYRYTSYDLEDTPFDFSDHPERNIWMGSADGGLFFERDLTAFGGDWVHTLEPRLYYLYQQFEDQSELPRFDAGELTFSFDQLFRDNRFAGLDRIGDANQLSAALTTRLLDPSFGREQARFSLGQIFYFENRDVTLAGPPTAADRNSSSQIAAEALVQTGRGWRVRAGVVYDHHEDVWDEAAISIGYQPDNRHIFNVGYRYREDQNPPINQTDVSAYFPISRRWSVLGRWNYDVEADHTIESIAGIEYDNCCWRLRFVWRAFEQSPTSVVIQDTEREVGVFLQVVFKGLASVGGKVDAMMERSIPGYRTEAVDEI